MICDSCLIIIIVFVCQTLLKVATLSNILLCLEIYVHTHTYIFKLRKPAFILEKWFAFRLLKMLQAAPLLIFSISFLPLSLHLRELTNFFGRVKPLFSALFWHSLLFYSICIHASLVEPNPSFTSFLFLSVSLSLSLAPSLSCIHYKYSFHKVFYTHLSH